MTERMLLRPPEAARELGISLTKLYDLVRVGEIPALKVGHSTRIPASALQAWIDERTARGPRELITA